MKIKQLTSYPIPNEIGLGNTNESYIRIENNIDVYDIFPPNVEVVVTDCNTEKSYKLKAKDGTEFRINQLGQIYRDYSFCPGDEIKFTLIDDNGKKTVFFSITKYNRAYICVGSKGTEIVNAERLNSFLSEDAINVYNIQIDEGTLKLSFEKSEKKRSDSPTKTDFYEATVNGIKLNKGTYYITIDGDKNTLEKEEKNKVEEFFLSNSNDEKKSLCPKYFLQTIYYGAPGTGKSYKVKSEKLQGVAEENIFRTTFHPDYDYASFVGCYKPVKEACEKTVLSYQELVDILKKTKDEMDQSRACVLMGFNYYDSLLKIDNEKKLSNFVSDAGIPTSGYDTTVRCGMQCHKEIAPKLNQITYSFVPQVFTNAYVKAWNEMKNEEQKPVYLVIEEINRGNCAQIFGDLFQLLDRGDNGKSEYSVDADEDLKNYLLNAVDDKGNPILVNKEGIKGDKLCLPPNLNILATMNTSDQSLFPMDSAFKRRWEWEYVPIRYTEAEAKDVNDNFHTFKITIGNNTYKWVEFLAKVNEKILAVTDSEDKQMGEYFIKKDIDEKTFINKVMYYLWSEVCKDNYKTNLNLFFTDDGTEFSFNELFKDKATELLVGFMEKLQV